MEIIPAILPKDFADLEDKVAQVKDFVDTVQIDICDGQFTPTATWPYKKNDENFEAILREERGLPGWEDIDFEIHLMAKNPEEIIQEWITAGAKRIIIHPKSTQKLDECVALMKGIVEIGFAFDVDEEIQIEGADFIQIMGIQHIGKQGEPFDARVIEKVKDISLPVSVDGGINLDTIRKIKADRYVIGSAIFESDNIPQTIEEFRSIIGA